MRHQRTGKKLGRDSAHRRALYANLASNLIEHERIRTTITKAKAVKPIAEQMITLGRRGDMHARRQAVAFLRSKDIVHKLFDELGPRYADRPGGYSRIIRIGPRQGDAAEMCYLELVDTPLVFKTKLEDVEEPETRVSTRPRRRRPTSPRRRPTTPSPRQRRRPRSRSLLRTKQRRDEPSAEAETAEPEAAEPEAAEPEAAEPEAEGDAPAKDA